MKSRMFWKWEAGEACYSHSNVKMQISKSFGPVSFSWGHSMILCTLWSAMSDAMAQRIQPANRQKTSVIIHFFTNKLSLRCSDWLSSFSRHSEVFAVPVFSDRISERGECRLNHLSEALKQNQAEAAQRFPRPGNPVLKTVNTQYAWSDR